MSINAPQPDEVLLVEKDDGKLASDIEGLIPAEGGVKPITDFAAFMASVPDFGEDADRLIEAIMEERAARRAMVNQRKDEPEW